MGPAVNDATPLAGACSSVSPVSPICRGALRSVRILRQPSSAGRLTLTQKILDSWAREVSVLAVHANARALESMTRLYHLVGSPAALLHPALIGAAVWGRLRGYGPATTRPTGLGALVDA